MAKATKLEPLPRTEQNNSRLILIVKKIILAYDTNAPELEELVSAVETLVLGYDRTISF
jgi:hypothetical protein